MVSNTGASSPGEPEMTFSTFDVAACRSNASERCPRTSASSRVRASSCFFNSISELGSSLTCALAFVPVERSLRPRVGLFAPLRDKVTSSAQSLVPSGQPSLSILTEPRDELAPSCMSRKEQCDEQSEKDDGIFLEICTDGGHLPQRPRRLTHRCACLSETSVPAG